MKAIISRPKKKKNLQESIISSKTKTFFFPIMKLILTSPCFTESRRGAQAGGSHLQTSPGNTTPAAGVIAPGQADGEDNVPMPPR